MTRQHRLYFRGFDVDVELPFDLDDGLTFRCSEAGKPISEASASVHEECRLFIDAGPSAIEEGIRRLEACLAALLIASAPNMDRCWAVHGDHTAPRLRESAPGFYCAFGSFAERVGADDLAFVRQHHSELEPFMLRQSFSRFGNALKSYVSGVMGPSADHNFLDFSICLEGLFAAGYAEISFRVALNCANLLGDSRAERLEVYRDCRWVYETRSRLIHGAPIHKDEERAAIALVDNGIPVAHSLCQRALRRTLEYRLIPILESKKQLPKFFESMCFGATIQEAKRDATD